MFLFKKIAAKNQNENAFRSSKIISLTTSATVVAAVTVRVVVVVVVIVD